MSLAHRRAVAILLVTFIIFAWAPPTAGAGCDKRCYESVDIVECRAARMGHNNCRITSSCWVGAVDPDGPGGNPPIVFTECTYNCHVDYCVWV
jgi:hypothetical protein